MQNSSKPTELALLSGLLCDDFVWQEVAERLSEVAHCHIFSFAGCSSITEMAEKVLAGTPQQFALAGHSMGGRVALEVYRLAPHRVSHLALLNTGVHPRSDAEVPGRQRLLDLSLTEGMNAVCEQWLPPMMSDAGRANSALMQQLRDMVTQHTPEEFHGEIQALLNRPDAEAVLPSVNVPTLLLSGDEDAWSPVSQHQDIQQCIQGSHLIGLPQVGHMSTVEAPELIADAFKTWLQR